LRVLVDTSVWADFLNGHRSVESDELVALLEGDDEVCTCGIVVAEVFQGLRRAEGREAIRRSFEDLTFLEPSGIGLYLRAAEVFRALRARGRTIRSTVDCVIAVIAEQNGCAVLARDRDLEAIAASGLLRVPAWPVGRP
jgi:predicted nucleic acid-binding protein